MYQIHVGASFDNTRVTDVAFADDSAILVELLKVLVLGLEAVHEELETPGLLGQDQGRGGWRLCWINQWSLFMHVVMILRSLKTLHGLIAGSTAVMHHVKKPSGGLACPR